MPSISGPRSTAASNFTVTPFVSGATCSLPIVLLSVLPVPNPRFKLRAATRDVAGLRPTRARIHRRPSASSVCWADDLTSLERAYQDWAVEYDVIGKQRAHLRG